jgi:hypothetical protein
VNAKRILIVEDHTVLRGLVRAALRKAFPGVTTIEARDGAEGGARLVERVRARP